MDEELADDAEEVDQRWMSSLGFRRFDSAYPDKGRIHLRGDIDVDEYLEVWDMNEADLWSIVNIGKVDADTDCNGAAHFCLKDSNRGKVRRLLTGFGIEVRA